MSTAPTTVARPTSGWWLVPALFLMLSGTIASNRGAGVERIVLAVVLASLALVVLFVLRTRPVLAALLSGGLVSAYFVLGLADGPVFLLLPTVGFLLPLQLSPRRWVPAVAAVWAVVGAGLLVRGATSGSGAAPEVQHVLVIGAVMAAACAVAIAVRSRRQTAAERASRAATEEQLRMAHDLHDGVGHGLAVIAMQSGVALHLLEKDVVDRAAARRALQAIRDTSRESLEALRVELSRLATSAAASRAPRRGLADLDILAERVRAGGLAVDVLDTRDAADALPQEVDETAYVIVQEALTNVLRHASADRAVVEVRAEVGDLEVSVSDDGRGGPVVEGLGITGMRARVRRLGGTLEVGKTSKGFEVRAVLPLGEPR